jgi:4-hydroxyphenylpyruvate dioxygenase
VLSQPFDYFDEAVLFYRSLLGMHDQASEDVASPHGLVRSRAVRSAGGGVRLVLNVPLLGGGRLAEAATYQHVAFSCADIFAAARAMRPAGAATLPIPANYYDDLTARFDLAAGLADRLRDFGVLYDRDAHGGEFFHFYTVMLGRRLFFEIVQRAGGYDGFGAFNTPVRMAAQLHHATVGGLPARPLWPLPHHGNRVPGSAPRDVGRGCGNVAHRGATLSQPRPCDRARTLLSGGRMGHQSFRSGRNFRLLVLLKRRGCREVTAARAGQPPMRREPGGGGLRGR